MGARQAKMDGALWQKGELMSECMTFPDTVEEFMDSYKIVDTEQVYTNGTEMVPIYRMRQWFEHEPEIIRCKDCKHYKAYEYTGRLACHYVIGGEVVRNPDDFCSRAERISDDKD